MWDINCMQKGHNLSEDMNTDHSTQKPLECMWRPIRNHLDKDGDDVVYDPFLGSGTTLIAAERHGVGCIGIEISGSYCDMIVRRWIKERRKMDLSADVFRNGERCDLFAKEESDPVYLWQLKEKS